MAGDKCRGFTPDKGLERIDLPLEGGMVLEAGGNATELLPLPQRRPGLAPSE